jgi:hypothetical protein
MKTNNSESEVRQNLTRRAEELFGRARAEELKPDIEQLTAEIIKLYSFEIGTHDEP